MAKTNLRPYSEDHGRTPLNGGVLQGAATALDFKNNTSRKIKKPAVKNWQYKAFEYYDEVPEVRFAANFIGNALSRIKLVAAEIPTELNEPPTLSKKKAIVDAVRNLSNSRTRQAGLLRRFGQQIFLAGEAYLCGNVDDDTDTQDWEVYSTIELRDNNDKTYSVQEQEGEPYEAIPQTATVFRVWNEHPSHIFRADSAMRVVQTQCEKLLTLDRADVSIARSRFAGSGILTVPIELLPPSLMEVEDDIEPSDHPMIIGLQEAMVEPITGDLQPEDVLPSLLIGPAEFLKEIRHITLEKQINAYSEEQKMSAIRRMATAMDLPNEVLLGMSDTNHWTAWQIKEETFQNHLRPFVEIICNSLTVAYLHPALKAAGVENYKKYIIWYDDTDLVARPDKSENAFKNHEAMSISDEALRRETGFDEKDAPSEEEFNRRAALAMRNPKAAWLLDGDEDPDIRRAHDAKSPYPQDKSRPDPNQPGPAKSPLPGTEEGRKEADRKNPLTASAFSERDYGYIDASIDRALEKAGAKVRALIPKNAELSRALNQYQNAELLYQLNETQLATYNIKVEKLLDFSTALQYLKSSGIEDLSAAQEYLKEQTLRKIGFQV